MLLIPGKFVWLHPGSSIGPEIGCAQRTRHVSRSVDAKRQGGVNAGSNVHRCTGKGLEGSVNGFLVLAFHRVCCCLIINQAFHQQSYSIGSITLHLQAYACCQRLLVALLLVHGAHCLPIFSNAYGEHRSFLSAAQGTT